MPLGPRSGRTMTAKPRHVPHIWREHTPIMLPERSATGAFSVFLFISFSFDEPVGKHAPDTRAMAGEPFGSENMRPTHGPWQANPSARADGLRVRWDVACSG